MSDKNEFDLQPQIPRDDQLVSLLQQCAHGDEDALAELYRATSGNLFALQVRILGMNPMSERALHDTYSRIWLKAGEYSPVMGSPMPWLTSIARNHALNLKRARTDLKDNTLGFDETSEMASEYTDTNFLNNYAASQPIKRCLDKLDVNTSDAIVRAYLDGWSLQELSQAYNKPVDSLKESIHAGMLSFRGQV